MNLPHSADLRLHEEPYLKEVFDFICPEDEPDLDISTYIYQLTRGDYSYDPTPRLIFKE